MTTELNIIDDQERLQTYLGSIKQIYSATFIVDENIRGFISHADQTFEDFFRSLDHYHHGILWKKRDKIDGIKQKFNKYIAPIKELYKEVHQSKPFLVAAHGNTGGFSAPTFTKCANISAWLSNRCILPLKRERHLGMINKVDGADRNFNEKDDKIVWRGATTGLFQAKPGVADHSSRFYVAKRWEALSKYDIGFTRVVQPNNRNTDIKISDLQKMTKEFLGIKQQLKSKFIISLEGVDIASGLRWMLYSKSVVIMPDPRCESWYCERFLRPFQHYVPVKHDLSDIDDVYDWCLNHGAKCEEIAMNGRAFVESLLDRSREDRLARMVVDEYASKVSFKFVGKMKKIFD